MLRYHMIRSDDMLNGDGLRVIVFLSGCDHHCSGCHNPETWDENSGQELNEEAIEQIISELKKEYISGLTVSGGDPLSDSNVYEVHKLILKIRRLFPDKSIWMYTGYTLEEIFDSKKIYGHLKENCINWNRLLAVLNCDVLVDGQYIKDLSDVNYPWAGSTNQRVIDMRKTLESGTIVLYKS